MVIPMGSMGAGMQGDFPAEVDRNFRRLKGCVLGMMLSAAGVIIFQPLTFAVSVFSVILSSLNIFLNAIFGIWMLKQDPLIGRMFQCLASSCCGPCAEQCQGGLGCLMPFMFANGITIFFALISGDIVAVFKNVNLLFSPVDWANSMWGFFYVMWGISVILEYLTQLCAIVFGYSAYKQVRDSGVTMTGGAWAQQGGGGATSGGGVYRAGTGQASGGDDRREPLRPAQQNFQAFGGGGQRLGGQ